ncbi:MAG: hypothetical protein Q4E56_05235 [Pseudomonadota bacterium]|nr:hypothetical protein [Pseudomonadota bacterium]
MSELMKKRLANLLSVKSISTIALTAGFLYGFIVGKISGQEFMTIFSVVIAFYFGTQSQKGQDAIDAKGE